MRLSHKKKPQRNTVDTRLRHGLVFVLFSGLFLALLVRAIDLQHHQSQVLQKEGNNRQVREVNIPAHRGEIVDRHGNILAVSAPAYSIWVDPQYFAMDKLDELAQLSNISKESLRKRIERSKKKRFVYVRRQAPPNKDLNDLYAADIPGLHFDVEYRRYYPDAEISAHIVGTTNIDGVGMESAERAFDGSLRSTHGKKKVVRDRHKRAIEQIEVIKAPVYGQKLQLSIDRRIQYSAYRALKKAVLKNHAQGGSAVVLDAQSGEILAMVNQPSFNPNQRGAYKPETRRNRSLTDMFEPGSTIKPFVVAALIENQPAKKGLRIDTSPGYYKVGKKRIEDVRNFGSLDLSGILVKSSNVGISKLATMMDKEALWGTFDLIGFGRIPGTGFPGETRGRLRNYSQWADIDQAIIAYGYSLAVSLAQLANAYAAFANDGWQPSMSFIKDNPHFEKRQIFEPATARYIRNTLRLATADGGTGSKAQVTGYSTAGKTGTVRKSHSADQEDESEYLSLFVGFVPAHAPRVIAAVMIDTPKLKEYYGGDVAAPVFSEIMAQVVRFMQIPPEADRFTAFREAKEFKKVSR